MKRIFQNTLIEYCKNNYEPWHMPGHKRKCQIASHNFGVEYDVTELPGLDNLHAPEGAISQSMKQLTDIYGSWKSYYLVNGSTAGILTAISAVCNRGDSIIMGRHCHKSVYHAVALLELKPIYLYPKRIEPYRICNSILAEQVKEAFKQNPEAKAVIFPSPTYEGILSDIKEISRIVHKNGAYLIVDEAHGAHLEFGVETPLSAVHCGADMVIQSLHKTLPCYTQCALLHLCIGEDVIEKREERLSNDAGSTDAWDLDINEMAETKGIGYSTKLSKKKRLEIVQMQERIERYLSVYQTSSPSYLLVANMEDGIVAMKEWQNTRIISYYDCLRRYRKKWEQLKKIHLMTEVDVYRAGGFAYDETKLIFCVDRILCSGEMFLEWLEEKCGVVLEMASLNYGLAMSTVSDTEESFSRFDYALQQADEMLMNLSDSQIEEDYWNEELTENTENMYQQEEDEYQTIIMLPGEAWKMENRYESLRKAKEKIAGEFITVYPPGIPVLVPGECIEERHIAYLQECLEKGLTVHGITIIESQAYLKIINEDKNIKSEKE